MRMIGSPAWRLIAALLFFSLAACRLLTGALDASRPTTPATTSPTPSPAAAALTTAASLPGTPSTLSRSTEVNEKTPAPESTQTGLATSTPYVPVFNADGVRYCAFVPGVSTPAQAPAELAQTQTSFAYPTFTPPAPVPVDREQTERQLALLDQLWRDVEANYIFSDFNGVNWEAVGVRYRRLVARGMDDEAFYRLMDAMLIELGDEHSYFLSPDQVAQEAGEIAGENDFVGIGTISVGSILEGDYAVVVSVFPGSPAEEAGIRIHDIYLAVDGGPIYDAEGNPRTLGEEGTALELTVQTPGEPPRTVELVRRRITGELPVESCLVPDTRIGYVYIPTFLDETIDDQVRQVLETMSASGPLEGIILDNRMNSGGMEHVTIATLRLFTRGLQGHFISRDIDGRPVRRALQVRPEDIGGSQNLPLVVLVSQDTASYAEIFSGILDRSGRATLVGETTLGNVEILFGYDYPDGSQAWIAGETFQPSGLENGIWEEQGIVPDVPALSVWEYFTEASDPGLAAAVEIIREAQPQ